MHFPKVPNTLEVFTTANPRQKFPIMTNHQVPGEGGLGGYPSPLRGKGKQKLPLT